MQKRLKHIIIFFLIVLFAFTTDRVTKLVAKEYLPRGVVIRVIGDFFVLMYAENQGAFLGLGADLPRGIRKWVLVIFPTVLLVVFVVGLFIREKNPSLTQVITMAAVVGGGLGNLFDRVFRVDGSVVDFMNLGIGPVLRSGIFNIADVWIIFGAIILIISESRGKSSKTQPETSTPLPPTEVPSSEKKP